MIFAAGPTDPISWDFSTGDWVLLGATLVGLVLAAIAVRRGPRETLDFGRAELAGWVLGTGFFAYVVAQPWFFGRPTDPSAVGQYYAIVGAQRLLVAVLAIAGMRILLSSGNPAGLPAPSRGRLILWALLLYLVVLPFILLLGRFNGEEVTQNSARLLTESTHPWTRSAMFFGLVIATPLFEEVVFRGFFQGGMRRIMGPESSVMLASLIFMLVHQPVAIWPQVLCLGALLGLVYERTRTLWAPVAVHVLHNGLTFGYLTLFHD